MNRRSLLTGLASLLAAPAIVRATSIMPVKAFGPGDLCEATLEDALIKCREYMLPTRLGIVQAFGEDHGIVCVNLFQ